MDYVIYFLGPVLIGVVGAKLLRQRFRVFAIGLATFLLTWTVMQTTAGVAAKVFGIAEKSLLYALIVSLLAGVCEESARYIVFRNLPAFRGNQKDGRASRMLSGTTAWKRSSSASPCC